MSFGRSERLTLDTSRHHRWLNREVDQMNDNRKWRAAHIEDLEKRGRFTPLREHLGIHSFGINAITLGEDGTLINEHDESGSGQEEVYVVLRGIRAMRPSSPSVALPARPTSRSTGARHGRSTTSQ
jgi:hypothetical protein